MPEIRFVIREASEHSEYWAGYPRRRHCIRLLIAPFVKRTCSVNAVNPWTVIRLWLRARWLMGQALLPL